jgi:hypothetical protein
MSKCITLTEEKSNPNMWTASLIKKTGQSICTSTQGVLPCGCEVRGHCMCKEMPVIPVNRVVVKRRIIGKNGGPRRRRGARGR